MNPEEFSEFEGRYYLDPTLSRDSQLQFIDTLRDVQARNTAQINADTYRLGTQVPSNLGGLGGAENTFVARYQKPQTEQTVADLRTAAQSSALNTALSNLQNAYKKRYNDAMLNYQQRAAKAATTPANNDYDEGVENIPTPEGTINQGMLNEDGSPNTVTFGPEGTITSRPEPGTQYWQDSTTGETVRKNSDGTYDILENGVWVRQESEKQPSVNDVIKELESQGKTVTNNRIQADANGNVTLEWVDSKGNRGSTTVKVSINNRGY